MKILNFIQKHKNKWFFPVIGFLALIWFLVRVIPKPSRASYPCMQVAFPFASAFVLWIITVIGALFHVKKAREFFRRSKYLYGAIAIAGAIVLSIIAFIQKPDYGALASEIPDRYKNADALSGTTDTNEMLTINKETVSIIRSDKDTASQIAYPEIKSMVRSAIQAAGGFDTLIQDSMTVLLKPNLGNHTYKDATDDYLPPEINGMSTDYRVTQAVVDLVREQNPNGKVYVFEGGARDSARTVMDLLEYDKITGITDLIYAEELTYGYKVYDQPNLVEVSLPTGKNLYNSENKYYLYTMYKKADVVISIPTLKVHGGNGVITCAVKNVGIGATPCDIYASEEGALTRGGINHNEDYLARFIHDYYMCRPVDYVIIDGLQAMEKGAHAYREHMMNMRLIMAGKDAIAVDNICSHVMSQDPKKISYLNYLDLDKAGCNDTKFIRVTGNRRVDDVKTFFKNWYGDAKVYDFTGPEFEITGMTLLNDTLHINTSNPANDIIKMEIEINETLMDSFMIGNYDYFALNVANKGTIDSVTLHSYDQYLNHTQKTYHPDPTKTDDLLFAEKEEALQVSPNPIQHTTTLTISGEFTGTGKVTIFNTANLPVKTFPFIKRSKELSKTVDLSDLKRGIYILRCKTGNQQLSQKIVKQ